MIRYILIGSVHKSPLPEIREQKKMTMVLSLRDHLDNPLLRNMPSALQQQGCAVNALTHFATVGHYVACKWLIASFKITTHDVRKVNNEPLRRAVRHGHLEICKLLSNEFALNRHDAAANDNEALRVAATNGDLSMCMWLAAEFKLTRRDAMARECDAVHGANRNGHCRVVLWLISHFGLTSLDVRGRREVDVFGTDKVRSHFVSKLSCAIEKDWQLTQDVLHDRVTGCGSGSWIVKQVGELLSKKMACRKTC